jgi:hypothetical protein
MRARITAYAGVQLRDYFVARMPLIVMATVATAWAYAATNGLTMAAFDASAGIEGRAELQRAFQVLLATFAFIAASVAAHGLVARDRRRGYDRVIFSRPLDPVRYYTQGFVLAGVAGALLGAAAADVYAVAVHPVSVLGAAAYIGLAWLTIGGLAFALSTVTRFHLPLLVLLLSADFALDRYATSLRASGAGSAVIDLARYLLPPGHVVASLSEPFSRGFTFDGRVLIWPLAFGVACFVAALVLLRRRPFGS